ncbi:MAG: tetratricopeptide repeat protein [Flavobacteriales bacterium]
MQPEHPLQKALKDAQKGRVTAAINSVRIVIRQQPRNADALQILAMLLTQVNQFDQAIVHLNRAVKIGPGVAAYRYNLGNALSSAGRHQEAVETYREVLRIDPAYFRAWLGLALALKAMNDTKGSLDACGRGIALRPDWPEMVLTYASVLESADRMEQGTSLLAEAVARYPLNTALRSRFLSALNHGSSPAEEITARHRALMANSSSPGRAAIRPADPERPIRIGVLSGDLRTHPVGYFAAPLFAADRTDASVVVFATNPPSSNDPLAKWYRSRAARWIEVAALDDAALDQAIRAQGIDVLVELSGHTAMGRLSALDHKPAPVIVSAMGYPNTTGHPMVDWRLVDPITDPQGSEHLATEQLLRVEPCFLCYSPPLDAPEPAMPDEVSPPTFGSFNLTSKVGEATVHLWAQVLDAVPGSRLILKSRSVTDPAVAENILRRLIAGGIALDRLEFLPYAADVTAHLDAYRRVHVALDTTPYNGTTTTCEALWMGVPVITLAGDRHASRVGASLLGAASMPGLVAGTPKEFVEIAARTINDRPGLMDLRVNGRGRLGGTALLDQATYGSKLHAALRSCWRAWCGTQGAN